MPQEIDEFCFEYELYHCPFCYSKIEYIRDSDVICTCGQTFWVDFSQFRQPKFIFFQDGNLVKNRQAIGKVKFGKSANFVISGRL